MCTKRHAPGWCQCCSHNWASIGCCGVLFLCNEACLHRQSFTAIVVIVPGTPQQAHKPYMEMDIFLSTAVQVSKWYFVKFSLLANSNELAKNMRLLGMCFSVENFMRFFISYWIPNVLPRWIWAQNRCLVEPLRVSLTRTLARWKTNFISCWLWLLRACAAHTVLHLPTSSFGNYNSWPKINTLWRDKNDICVEFWKERIPQVNDL